MTLRALIVVTHLLGAGHLTRAAALGRALANAGHDVTLVSGGTPTALIDVSGLRFAQLPPVRARVDDFSTLRDIDGEPVGETYLTRRRDQLLASFAAASPDVVITELYPFGRRVLAAEFKALIDAVGATAPRPALVSSIRDILVAPTKSARVAATLDIVESHYDAVLVHGDETLVPLEASWPVDARLNKFLTYAGYIGPGGATRTDAPSDGSILVSGGSSEAAVPLYRAALSAAMADPGRRWHILVGTAVPAAAFETLGAGCPRNVTLERARTDFRDLMAKAAVFVGQAGYNTIMDIVATRSRAVLVPFEQGRETEQRLRAEQLERRGLAVLLPEISLGSRSLSQAVANAACLPRPTFDSIRIDGGAVAARRIEEIVAARRASRPLP